jgi:hypothetical protein
MSAQRTFIAPAAARSSIRPSDRLCACVSSNVMGCQYQSIQYQSIQYQSMKPEQGLKRKSA